MNVIEYVSVLICSSLIGCGGIEKPKNTTVFSVRKFNRDMRLCFVSEVELADLVKRGECVIIVGPETNQWKRLLVSEGKQFGTLFASFGQNYFTQDSAIVVGKKYSISRRTQWYDDEKEPSSLLEFTNRMILPGDVIWIPPVQ